MVGSALLSLAAALVGLTGSPSIANGQGGPSPVSLWDAAYEAREQGDLARAVELLRRSYDGAPLGRTACDLASTLVAMERRAEAAAWLERCASHDDVGAADRAAAEEVARRLELEAGTVELRNVEGRRVEVDGEPLSPGVDGATLTLAAGRHRLLVHGAGGGERTVDVRGGERMAVDLIDPGASAAAARRGPSAPWWALWTTLSVSLASIAGGATAYAFDVELSGRPDRWDDAVAARLASGVLFGVAGAALATTFVLLPYALGGGGRETERDAADAGLGGRWM